MNKLINTVVHGDCLNIMKDIDDKSIDLILADLPYGTVKCGWDIIIPFEALWLQYQRIIKDNGAIVLTASGWFTAQLMLSNVKLWRYNLIWEKTTPTGFLNAKKMPLRIHEDIVVFYKSLPTYIPQKTIGHVRKVSSAVHKRNCVKTEDYGKHELTTYDSTERYPTSILKFPTDKQREALHPTQKPIDLGRYLIRTYTHEGDVVLDNACGSGSFLVAAKLEKRNFIGIEKEQKYVNIANKRLAGII